MNKLEKLSLENFNVISSQEMQSLNGGAKTKDKIEKVTGNAGSDGIGVDYEKEVHKD